MHPNSFCLKRLVCLAVVGLCFLVFPPLNSTEPPVSSGQIVPEYQSQIAPLLKNHCVRCHGPAKQDAKLNLALGAGLVRGGKNGKVILPGNPDSSLLWQHVSDNSMPKGEAPLTPPEKALLRQWIEKGAVGLPTKVSAKADGDEHWAYQKMQPVNPPVVKDRSRIRTPIDAFLQARLERSGLTLLPDATQYALIRRVSFALRGLPPTLAETEAYLKDQSPKAYENMVERYLSSPQYGERWGKFWLDAAGYADSNGFFNADTDRPLAWRYRDYVIDSINRDLPFDQFLREQLAGDEIARYSPKLPLSAEGIRMLSATHFLRNSPDGTDSSDGNEDEVRADKYAVLEGTVQILGSSLFGMTVQCARCHNHKFEPVSQADYYRLQAILYPAFNVEKWAYPRNRDVVAATEVELETHKTKMTQYEANLAKVKSLQREWLEKNPEPTVVLFKDDFDTPNQKVATLWSTSAPGDDAPLGLPLVQLDSAQSPAVNITAGGLHVVESGALGDRAISTKQSFDWTPDKKGDWIQVRFDLVKGAPYVGFLIALGDYNDKKDKHRGNILFDGAESGQAKVYVDYPGPDGSQPGAIGESGYKPGKNYGVRVTNRGNGSFELTQWVEGYPEKNSLSLKESDLPNGGFGFALCCGRSYVVDNVKVEKNLYPIEVAKIPAASQVFRQAKLAEFAKKINDLELAKPKPLTKLAPVVDLSPVVPSVFLLERGIHKARGERVNPAPPSVLLESDKTDPFGPKPLDLTQSTGTRLALAQWITKPKSRAVALLARVTVNRWWQNHFGRGIASTADNLGYSGSPPSHPELLEWLAGELIQTGWSQKGIHRIILHSTAFRQLSTPTKESLLADEDNTLLSRFPLRRLDAESVRDGMLALSGELELVSGGPYVPTSRGGDGDVVVQETTPGAKRRSIYLQQRRTQTMGMLEIFDAPSIVFNCTVRLPTTVPLQSLILLNSQFARLRAEGFAKRLLIAIPTDFNARLAQAFLLAWGRPPTQGEESAAKAFLVGQTNEYAGKPKQEERAWTDLANMLLASNAFLYVE